MIQSKNIKFKNKPKKKKSDLLFFFYKKINFPFLIYFLEIRMNSINPIK
jgi:hypothetical protein